jgi:hypothetical protein
MLENTSKSKETATHYFKQNENFTQYSYRTKENGKQHSNECGEEGDKLNKCK